LGEGKFKFFALFGKWQRGSDEVAESAMILISRIAKHAARVFSLQKTTGMRSASSSGGGKFIYTLLSFGRRW
jgi:hypothetical protein